MLGISLVFVGIALVLNGVLRLYKADAKSIAAVNIMTGTIIVAGNFILLFRAVTMTDYMNVTSGFLFGFTYLFIAANYLFKLDIRPFGWFCGFVAVYAIVQSAVTFCAGGMPGYVYGALWAVWAILWLEGFVEIVFKLKLEKVYIWLSISEGVFAAFIPAMLILFSII